MCSASISAGQVFWSAEWTRGELALGIGIANATSVDHHPPGHGRHALAVLVAADGVLSVSYGSTSSRVDGPPLQPGDTLALGVDMSAGVLFIVGAPRRGLAQLRQLEDGAPLRQRTMVKRTAMPHGYEHASFFDDEPPPPAGDAVETSRAAIALPVELCSVPELFLTVALRTGSAADAVSAATSEIVDGRAPAAEATVRFGAPVAELALHSRGFRPLSLALAAQRSAGRTGPLVAAPPPHLDMPTTVQRVTAATPADLMAPSPADHAVTNASSDASSPPQLGDTPRPRGDAPGSESLRVTSYNGSEDAAMDAANGEAHDAASDQDVQPEQLDKATDAVQSANLEWECFFGLCGACSHLDPGGCCAAGWWVVVQQTDPEQLYGKECSVCCDALVRIGVGLGSPEPGLEVVSTQCGQYDERSGSNPWCHTCRPKERQTDGSHLARMDVLAASSTASASCDG
jgi:hypothetical protein